MSENPYEPPKREPENPKAEYAYPYRRYELIGLLLFIALAILLLLPLF